jgi:hypothetical protein
MLVSYILYSNIETIQQILQTYFVNVILKRPENAVKFYEELSAPISAESINGNPNARFTNYGNKFKIARIVRLYMLDINMYPTENYGEINTITELLPGAVPLDKFVSFKNVANHDDDDYPDVYKEVEYMKWKNPEKEITMPNKMSYLYFSSSDTIRNQFISMTEFILLRLKLAASCIIDFFESDIPNPQKNRTIPLKLSVEFIDISIPTKNDKFNRGFMRNIPGNTHIIPVEKSLFDRQNYKLETHSFLKKLSGRKIVLQSIEYLSFDLYNIFFYNNISIILNQFNKILSS